MNVELRALLEVLAQSIVLPLLIGGLICWFGRKCGNNGWILFAAACFFFIGGCNTWNYSQKVVNEYLNRTYTPVTGR